jgi:hypothetical protein
MLCREIIAVYFENYAKHTDTVYRQNAEFYCNKRGALHFKERYHSMQESGQLPSPASVPPLEHNSCKQDFLPLLGIELR